ncbi:hypothetical protein BT69DRAFT_1281726 [Atractiella rhizophila]|nr:hypothetical protein BT69DRAFT_1281726 [Atractiella rhizophila]
MKSRTTYGHEQRRGHGRRSRSSVDLRNEISELEHSHSSSPSPSHSYSHSRSKANNVPIRRRVESIESSQQRREADLPSVPAESSTRSERRASKRSSHASRLSRAQSPAFPIFSSCFEPISDEFDGKGFSFSPSASIGSVGTGAGQGLGYRMGEDDVQPSTPKSPMSFKSEASGGSVGKNPNGSSSGGGLLGKLGLKKKPKKKDISAPMGITAEGVDVLNLFQMDESKFSDATRGSLKERERKVSKKMELPPGLGMEGRPMGQRKERSRTLSHNGNGAPVQQKRRTSHAVI